MLFEPTLRSLVGPGLHTKMDVIRRQGNAAVHRAKPVTAGESLPVVRELFHLMFWLGARYSRRPEDRPDPKLSTPTPFPDHCPRASALSGRRTSEPRRSATPVRMANAAHPVAHDFDEAATRDLYIDLLLREAG
jgi:type I restriction enzyme R subunit